jgi:hypothetical protein
MGSIMKAVTGGSDSKSSSKSGWGLLPKEIQDTYKNFSTQLGTQIGDVGNAFNPANFAPEAYNMLKQGFAPTAQSLQQDIGMLTNPFDQFVMDDVNRAAQSDYSILKQDMNAAGQLGSNRQQLGANDIEQTRLGTIGKLRQGQYNTALDQVLSQIIPQRQQDTQNRLNIQGQSAQSNITGLQEIAKALGILPTSGGSQDNSKSSSVGGLSSFFA